MPNGLLPFPPGGHGAFFHAALKGFEQWGVFNAGIFFHHGAANKFLTRKAALLYHRMVYVHVFPIKTYHLKLIKSGWIYAMIAYANLLK